MNTGADGSLPFSDRKFRQNVGLVMNEGKNLGIDYTGRWMHSYYKPGRIH